MQGNFSPLRLLILGLCLAGFWLYGGFESPLEGLAFEGSAHRASRGWVACIAMFLVGAVLVSVIDHYAGTMEPTNLRPLHIVLGVLLMGGAMVWLHVLRNGLASRFPA